MRSGLVEMRSRRPMSARSRSSNAIAATGAVVNAFVSGFGYNVDCAVASTVAHDSHHMIVVGTSTSRHGAGREPPARGRRRRRGRGSKGKELALRRTADRRPHVRRARPKSSPRRPRQMVAAMQACGCTLNNAYMQHSLLALVVIPELRISDIGLIDVRTFEKVELFV